MSDEYEDDWEKYDSGPFCRHWGDLACDEACKNCGHGCGQHSLYSPGECFVESCECKGWEEGDE